MVSKLDECPMPEDIVDIASEEEAEEEEDYLEERAAPEPEQEETKKEEETKKTEEEAKNEDHPAAAAESTTNAVVEGGNVAAGAEAEAIPAVGSIEPTGEKRKKRTFEERAEQRKIRRFRRAKISAYYSGSFYGKSVAQLMYSIAQQLNKESAEMLWHNILGVTYQYLHSSVSKLQYDDTVMELQREVVRINRQKEGSKMASEAVDETNPDKGRKISSINVQVGSIASQQELQFMLLRHWNLYDSAHYSNYIASRLCIWKEPGKRELNKIFALLGISLEEAKQQFKHLKPEYRKNITERVLDVANQLNLKDIAYNSFVRQYDRKTQYSASDLIYCLSSILECPKKVLKSKSEEGKEEIKAPEGEFFSASSEETLKENFWAAYDALGESQPEVIKQGIDLAIEMQIAVVNQGTSLIEKKSIYPAQGLRYAIIYNDNLQEVKFFQYPLALQKLALFVMEIYQESKKKATQRPFVLCVLNSKTNIFLVVGVTGTQGMTEVPRNEFGVKFRKAAKEANARVKYDGFETSIIEILRDDFDAFIAELCVDKSGNPAQQ